MMENNLTSVFENYRSRTVSVKLVMISRLQRGSFCVRHKASLVFLAGRWKHNRPTQCLNIIGTLIRFRRRHEGVTGENRDILCSVKRDTGPKVS